METTIKDYGLSPEAMIMVSCSNIHEYVEYERCKINGKEGCRSANFLSERV